MEAPRPDLVGQVGWACYLAPALPGGPQTSSAPSQEFIPPPSEARSQLDFRSAASRTTLLDMDKSISGNQPGIPPPR